jgi:ATP-dependent helicase/nuclease subunit A
MPMPVNDLDHDQGLAATAPGSEVAVTAGAGSGKTRVLVARFLRLLSRDRIPLDSIAAITFTNKAADQMKTRIAERAHELMKSDAENSVFWRNVAVNAHRARISTIHSFCSAILRRYPAEADIDPSFMVMDQVTASALKRDIVSGRMEERLAEGGDDVSFLLSFFGVNTYMEIILDLLNSRPQVAIFLDSFDKGAPDEDMFRSIWDNHLTARLDALILALRDFHAFRPAGDSLTAVYDMVFPALEQARCSIGEGFIDCDRLVSAANAINLRLGSSAKWGGKESLARLHGELDRCREFLRLLETYYRQDRTSAPRAATLLMTEYLVVERIYRQRKHERGVLDNDDLMIETWRLLRTRFDICCEVSNTLRHLMVDEFQDTDRLQMDILCMITGNSASSFFAVGDPKQSIYRFRGADVTVFNDFIRSIHTDFHRLTMNYRSTPGVMMFVNTIFAQLMPEEQSNHFETTYNPMKWFREASNTVPSVELTVIANMMGNMRRRKEAELIASRIAELAGSTSGYTYSDIAVLMRTGSALTAYEEALLAAGIPFVNRIGGKLAGSPESYDIGNLLGWLAKPDDPVLLTAVLLSPFFAVDGDALYALRTNAGSAQSMPSAFSLLADETGEGRDSRMRELIHAARILMGLRDAVDRVPVRELLERAFDETGYTLVMSSDPIRGDRSLAIIDLIVETAVRFERDGIGLLAFSELLRSDSPFTDETAQLETTGDAVSIMTLHSAKGLEFPVVFLPDITSAGRRGNGFLFDSVLGPGLTLRDERGRSSGTAIRRMAAETESLKETAESKRLFYVGCTRARDRLIISGAPPAKTGGFESNNWMTWLHVALGLPRDGSSGDITSDIVRYRWLDDAPSVRTIPVQLCANTDDIPEFPASDGSGFDRGLVETVDSLIAPLPVMPVDKVPEVISVTDLLDSVDGGDVFVKNDKNTVHVDSYGITYGKLMHCVLERIDFTAPETWDKTVQDIAGHFPNATGELVGTLHADIERFVRSDLAASLASATRIKREEPFMLMIGETLVRGVIDLLFETTNGIVIVDYKTGAAPAPDSPLMARYYRQLAIYALAVQRVTNRIPSVLTLAFLSADEIVNFSCTPILLAETATVVESALNRFTTPADKQP